MTKKTPTQINIDFMLKRANDTLPALEAGIESIKNLPLDNLALSAHLLYEVTKKMKESTRRFAEAAHRVGDFAHEERHNLHEERHNLPPEK